jgi:RNA polymerase sigma-70 factor (ECF subfamily)
MDAATPTYADDFAVWVSPHLPVLMALAMQEVGPTHADDVVQETLLRAWQRRDTYRAERGSVRAWLIAVLRDRSRRHRVRTRRPVPIDPPASVSAIDSQHVDLERAIASLPRRQREVVTLHYLADLPVSDIAVLLGVSAGSVKSYLHEARTALQQALEGG